MRPEDLEGKVIESVVVTHNSCVITCTDNTIFRIDTHAYNYNDDGDAEAGLDWTIF